eukprot:gene11881-biopygen16896
MHPAQCQWSTGHTRWWIGPASFVALGRAAVKRRVLRGQPNMVSSSASLAVPIPCTCAWQLPAWVFTLPGVKKDFSLKGERVALHQAPPAPLWVAACSRNGRGTLGRG